MYITSTRVSTDCSMARDVAVGASNALEVGSTSNGGKSDGCNGKLEDHCGYLGRTTRGKCEMDSKSEE